MGTEVLLDHQAPSVHTHQNLSVRTGPNQNPVRNWGGVENCKPSIRAVPAPVPTCDPVLFGSADPELNRVRTGSRRFRPYQRQALSSGPNRTLRFCFDPELFQRFC